MFDWDNVPTFLAVVRGGSLTNAASTLRLTESTVSRRIAALEAALGLKLFHRKHHGLELTHAAQRLVPSAEAMETNSITLEREVARIEEKVDGSVRVATVEEIATYALAPAVDLLGQRWPGLIVELVVGNHVANLSRQEADVAVRLVRPSQGDLVSRQLTNLPCHVYGTAALLGVAPGELPWLELGDDLDFAPESRWLASQLPQRRTALRSSSTTALASAATKGIGAVILPLPLAMRFPELIRLFPNHPPTIQRSLWLVAHRELAEVPRVRAAMDWVDLAVARELSATTG